MSTRGGVRIGLFAVSGTIHANAKGEPLTVDIDDIRVKSSTRGLILKSLEYWAN